MTDRAEQRQAAIDDLLELFEQLRDRQGSIVASMAQEMLLRPAER
jgi:acyl-CoA thioesterase